MTKRMREIQNEILKKSADAQGYLEGENKDINKANEILDEVDTLQKELDTLARAEKSKKAGVPAEGGALDGGDGEGKPSSEKAFADAVRTRFKDLNETTNADGGYTVPQDIVTKVNEYKQQRFSLANLIDREPVTTKSGSRVFKKRSQHVGFSEVAEGGKITGKVAAPQFELMEYSIKKYAGYLPVTNELLADSDAAINNTMIAWLGEEEIATENAQILAKVNAKTATALAGLDDIKKAINVTLAAFAGTVRIITNADGLQYLDTLKDKDGKYLLSPDPAEPMKMHLAVGARRIPVTVVPNDVLKTNSGKIPFILGDLREYVKEFDRQQLTLSTSSVAVIGDLNAYESDLTIIRGTMRADWRVKDAEAIVRGELTPAAAE